MCKSASDPSSTTIGIAARMVDSHQLPSGSYTCAQGMSGPPLVQPFGQDLGHMSQSKPHAPRVGGAAQVKKAARVIGHEHGRFRLRHVVELPRDDLAGDLGMFH